MRLYSGSSKQFIDDAVRNQIAQKLSDAFFCYYRFHPSPAERRSWQNSLSKMSELIQYAELLDHGIILEYQLPQSSKRLDFLICGKDELKSDNTVIVELKQWDACEEAEGPNEVITYLNGVKREVLHPSVQVGQYEMYLADTHTAFYEDDPIKLDACSYLHNYFRNPEDVIFANKFKPLLARNPIFTADDVDIFINYLQERLCEGNGLDVLKRVEESKYRPSKKLMEHVGNIIKNKSEYILLDDQLVAYDRVFTEAKKGFHTKNKTVIIVKGGPGTGKSIIAINLMADLLLNGYNAIYATGSRAFTGVLREIIGRRGSVQFKFFNNFTGAEHDEIDVLICDESHRIRKTSNSRFTPVSERSGVSQIEEIINAAKVSVFFIDDKQIVRPNEIGSVEYIRQNAVNFKTNIYEYELGIQFRCSGSEDFINWVNNTLGVERTANVLLNRNDNFDFKIFDSPFELENAIKEKVADGYTARMTAGFCWEWSDPDYSGNLKNDVVIGEFRRPWNAKPEAKRLSKDIPKAILWPYDPNGINQIGCIYTVQGFEFDYIGVIFGNDLVYDFKKQEWVSKSENFADSIVKRSGARLVDYLKNIYRVLLTRGLKGCYVYFVDKDTENFVRSRIDFS
jgi:hypothetical protein